MSPESAHSLKQHVRGSQVRHNEVEVNVHTLLHHLRCHKNTTWPVGAAFWAEVFKPVSFQFGTTLKRKSAAKQAQLCRTLAYGGGCSSKRFLRFRDCVSNPEYMLSGLSAGYQFIDGFLGRNHRRPQLDWFRWFPLDADMSAGSASRTSLIGRSACNQRVVRSSFALGNARCGSNSFRRSAVSVALNTITAQFSSPVRE